MKLDYLSEVKVIYGINRFFKEIALFQINILINTFLIKKIVNKIESIYSDG